MLFDNKCRKEILIIITYTCRNQLVTKFTNTALLKQMDTTTNIILNFFSHSSTITYFYFSATLSTQALDTSVYL